MGCVNSNPRNHVEKYNSSADPADIVLEGGKLERRESSDDPGFQKWSEMENAEEMTFINDEQGDAHLERLLDREFPIKVQRQHSDFSNVLFWTQRMKTVETESPDSPGLCAGAFVWL